MKEGWQIKRLGDICDLQNGYAFKSGDYIESSNTLNIRMSSIRPDGSFDSEHNQRFLPDTFAKTYESFLLKEDDLIIAMTDMAGDPKILGVPTLVANLNGRSFLMNQRVGKLFKFSESIQIPYLRYFLSSPSTKEFYKNKGAGGLQINISKGDVLSVDVPVPPLPEQQRIVAILDEAFESIAIAKANAEKNLQNARALFESYLDGVFSQKGEGWEEKPLAEICNVKDGTHDSPKYVLEGIPFVTQKNIKDNGFTLENTKFISQDDHDKFYKRSNVAYEDILISMIGANRGMACIVDNKMVFSIKNVGLVKRSDSINPYFLLYFLKSSMAAEYVSTRSKGGAQEFIGLTELRKFPIRTTSLMRQDTIVSMLDSVRKETQRLESLYQQKITALDELKKALLHQAFSGQL